MYKDVEIVWKFCGHYENILKQKANKCRSRGELGIFLFTTVSRTVLGPTQPPIQWAPRTLSLEVKR
jgi:hypothetical protein